jgi:hypothetical protein
MALPAATATQAILVVQKTESTQEVLEKRKAAARRRRGAPVGYDG